PRRGSIELRHHHPAVVEPGLVDPVLVAVQGEEAAVALEADRRERVEDGIGRQAGVRRAAQRAIGRPGHQAAAGIVKPTRTPPASFSAKTCPPWNSAIRRTRNRPRPRWLLEALRESRTETMESNRLSPMDSGRDWPRLKTDSRQPATGRRPPVGSASSRVASSIRMVVPATAKSTALATSLSSAWATASGTACAGVAPPGRDSSNTAAG